MWNNTKFSTYAVLLLLTLLTTTAAVVYDDQPPYRTNLFQYRCFSDNDNIPSTSNFPRSLIGLQHSDRVIHQLLSRIFAIFLREYLNFRQIYLIPLNFNESMVSTTYEKEKLMYALNSIHFNSKYSELSMIDLEVWMPPTGHGLIPETVNDGGASISPGRFGWFVPITLINDESEQDLLYSLHYTVFMNRTNHHYDQYIIDDENLDYLREGVDWVEYQNPLCDHQQCATLLAEFKVDTAFVVKQIEDTKSYLNVLWLGKQFREKIIRLDLLYQNNASSTKNRYVVMHWTPSDFIDAEIKFKAMIMPRCEEVATPNCKYELTPVLKYFSNRLSNYKETTHMLSALRKFSLNDSAFANLQRELLKVSAAYYSNNMSDDLYNEVACNWLKNNRYIADGWSIFKESTITTVYIGGIFPITNPSRGHQNLDQAVLQAESAINKNFNILKDYDLSVQINDGHCKADYVMKSFIHYFSIDRVLGVLGPACSDTVEPIAGISKHTNMAVISYSAEGASFVDRKAYPYFFRTIGSNRQYEDVYISLMKHFGWRRFAALTEDGQKYTEYISHMEANLKVHNLELIINKKFVSEVTSAEMNKYLVDLKQKHAKIIIADIYTKNAEMVLCEAYKLGMTAYEGYVWFLPAWLSKGWLSSNYSSNDSCTEEQLKTVTEGHFSLRHQPFGPLNATMQENITINQWLQNYNGTISNYTGFAYDAVWAYALAANKLLLENREAVNNLRTKNVTKRFAELIWETDFDGLSGRVRFGMGGSRITDLNIMQWRDSGFHEIGQFQPNIIGEKRNMRTDGGNLILQDNAIKWLANKGIPGDGTYDCSFSTLAELLATDCENASVIFTAIMCLLSVIMVSLVSFLFWKQRYNKKIKRSAKIMKTFGIDLLSPSRSKFNTLDKWEIPKANVVVNRRLGEGAFGTVYGGEAQIGSGGWTAVAVKTLKAGASTEDRIDFLSEAEAMKRFDSKNIVKLLGVCLQTEPIYTIMELMLYGDLKTYLLARRHMVNDKISDDSDISSKRLTQYAMDVAKGLAYLAEQKYVHRDIACRNCLVDAQRVVKLGDFGMARPIGESDYYRFNRKGMLPVRWMAPESLALGLFTPASDIWAFGVVLFEIITFGSFPFQGLTNNQVLESVKAGKCLQIPAGVKSHLEGLLKACWSHDAAKRPTAADIIDDMSKYPRLLSPCLDFPGASVEMPETESDELELLPKIRKCSPIKRDSTLDILAQTSMQNNFDKINLIDDLELLQHITVDMPLASNTSPLNAPYINPDVDAFSPITPDGYSIMSPLLPQTTNSESSDTSQQQAEIIRISPAESHQQTSL